MADVERDALIREVDEEVRREQLAKLWEKYSGLVLGAAAAIVLGVGGFKWYQNKQIAAAEAAGAQYIAANELFLAKKPDEARKSLDDIAKSAPGGYAALARLRAAGSLAKSDKAPEAVAAYDALAKDGSADQLLRGYAALAAASLRLQQADWTEMKNRLNDLSGDTGPWRFSARELLGLAAWKAGMIEEARKAYERILGDQKAPPTLRERAGMMMGQIVAAELAKAGGPGAAPAQATAKPASEQTSPAAAPVKPDAQAGKGKK